MKLLNKQWIGRKSNKCAIVLQRVPGILHSNRGIRAPSKEWFLNVSVLWKEVWKLYTVVHFKRNHRMCIEVYTVTSALALGWGMEGRPPGGTLLHLRAIVWVTFLDQRKGHIPGGQDRCLCVSRLPSWYAKVGAMETVGVKGKASGLGPKGRERTGVRAQGFAGYREQWGGWETLSFSIRANDGWKPGGWPAQSDPLPLWLKGSRWVAQIVSRLENACLGSSPMCPPTPPQENTLEKRL